MKKGDDGRIIFWEFTIGPRLSRLLYRLGRRNKNISINVLWIILVAVLIGAGCAWYIGSVLPPPAPRPICPPELHNLCT